MRAALSRAVPLVALLVAAVPVAQASARTLQRGAGTVDRVAIPGEDPRPSLTSLDEA